MAEKADSLRFLSSGVEIRMLASRRMITGTVVKAAAALCGIGTGTLHYGDGELSWKAPASDTFGPAIDVSAGGEFLLEDGDDANHWIRVEVYETFLPAGTEEVGIALSDVFNNAVATDDLSNAERVAGDVETWTITLKNESADPIDDVLVWIDGDVTGIEISDDGSTWVAPDTEGHADTLDFGTIAAAGTETLHVRRTISAGAAASLAETVLLHAKFTDADTEDRYVSARGLYRIFGAALYKFFRSNSTAPLPSDTPIATNATLPHEPTNTYADGLWRLSMSYTNGLIDSGFLAVGTNGETYRLLRLVSGAASGSPPATPTGILVTRLSGGRARVTAYYADAAAERADEWAIGHTTDGATDPAVDTPTVTRAIPAGVGAAVLDLILPTSGTLADGTELRVRVQVRRNDGTSGSPVWVYSTGSTVITTIMDAAGPAASVGAQSSTILEA